MGTRWALTHGGDRCARKSQNLNRILVRNRPPIDDSLRVAREGSEADEDLANLPK